VCGAVGAAGLILMLGASDAMPFDVRVARRLDDLIEKAQAVVVNPRRPPRVITDAGVTIAAGGAGGIEVGASVVSGDAERRVRPASRF
jgi:hypothetical protein